MTIIHFEVTNCDTNGTENFTKDFIKDFIKDFTKENNIEISERQYDILLLLIKDRTLTSQKISQKKPVSMRTILKDLAELQTKGIISREGGRKNGYWQLLFLPLD